MKNLLLLLLFSFCVQAEQSYVLSFTNPNEYYSVTVETPVSGKCMHVWEVPNPAITLNPNQSSQKYEIKDSNEYTANCKGEPKYVTWSIYATPLQKYASSYRRKPECYVKFIHEEYDGGWGTRVDTTCSQGQDNIIQGATCDGHECLNKEVKDIPEDAAININFFSTEQTSCHDRNAEAVYIDSNVIGIYPTWGGKDVNRIKIASGKGDFSGDFTFDYSLSTETGKAFFKYATLAKLTASRLQVHCDGNGYPGKMNVSY